MSTPNQVKRMLDVVATDEKSRNAYEVGFQNGYQTRASDVSDTSSLIFSSSLGVIAVGWAAVVLYAFYKEIRESFR